MNSTTTRKISWSIPRPNKESIHIREKRIEPLGSYQLRVCGERQHVGLPDHPSHSHSPMERTEVDIRTTGWIFFSSTSPFPMASESHPGPTHENVDVFVCGCFRNYKYIRYIWTFPNPQDKDQHIMVHTYIIYIYVCVCVLCIIIYIYIYIFMCLHTHVFSCMCIYIHGYFWETFLYSCGHLIYLKRSHQKYPPWCCLAMGLGWMG